MLTEGEKRFVLLASGKGDDPEKRDVQTGQCYCGESGCPRCLAAHWHVEIHNPDNYSELHRVQENLELVGREDLYQMFKEAFIGLADRRTGELGDLVVKGIRAGWKKK